MFGENPIQRRKSRRIMVGRVAVGGDVTDNLKSIRNGQGSISPDYGYSWYAGI